MQSLFFKAAKLGDNKPLEQGVNSDNIDTPHEINGYTILCFACANNQVDTVRLLLEQGADVNLQTTRSRSSALMLAAQNGHEKVIDLLLTAPLIDFTLHNAEGNNALMLAVSMGHLPIVEKLINGSDLTHLNNNGDSVFHLGDKPSINDVLINHLPHTPH
tara:strand:+ start:462 stop:941 length:480 start_codon:yes stop_codon:yes gene_type:complete